MLLFNLRSIVQQGVRRGIQADSIRRQLNRQGVSTAGLGVQTLYREAAAELANEQKLAGRSSQLIPRPGRDMIPKTFKVPVDFSYVVNVRYVDPDSSDVLTQARTVYSQNQLSKGQAEALAVTDALQGLSSPRGASDPFAPLEVDGGDLVNAYYNVSE